MRQLIVQVPEGRGDEALAIAERRGGVNLVQFAGRGEDGPVDLALLNLPNHRLGEALDDLEALSPLRVTFIPTGALTLHPPAEEAPTQVTDVSRRSPIEVYLGGLQSVGSWRGFLGYAGAAGAVVWIGLFTNTVYLLVAAMLIAPFAGPAMNAAVATARGDGQLLGRSLLRYFAALALTVAVAAALSFALRQEIATTQMVSASMLSSTAVLLPLVAGAAGALNLIQSERSSLVSGAATGMLVAASLAPPAGLVGMSAVIGRWDLAVSGLFVLLLQIAGINLSGALVFRAVGLSAHGPRYSRGRRWVFPAALCVTAAALAALLAWQFWSPPNLQRSTREQRAAAAVQEVVNSSRTASLIEANVRFTRASISGQNSLLTTLYVQPAEGAPPASDEEIKARLTRMVTDRIVREDFNVTPLVDVTVIRPSAQSSGDQGRDTSEPGPLPPSP
ncbi:DUF389 domain-containing protein [Alienimonas californiensis]|uniref:TIGR00341 family protein n=1 Tax=Alienimonas californiensis TaxID=2527989 RepID=A0A517P4H0_9PLAN|nr:DUF389 domain-containing protein [Alienimonas californiensis]QDT14292.1 hypothetical protein CA12_03640 [Alienimonas californiensis]